MRIISAPPDCCLPKAIARILDAEDFEREHGFRLSTAKHGRRAAEAMRALGAVHTSMRVDGEVVEAWRGVRVVD